MVVEEGRTAFAQRSLLNGASVLEMSGSPEKSHKSGTASRDVIFFEYPSFAGGNRLLRAGGRRRGRLDFSEGLLAVEQRLDWACQRLWSGHGAVAPYHVAFPVDQKLCEVPLDAA